MREKCEYGTFEKGTYLCRCIGLNLASDSTGTQVVSLWIWLSYMESSEKKCISWTNQVEAKLCFAGDGV